MGNPFSAIEAEEKVLRMNEERNEIYEVICQVPDIEAEYGQAILKRQVERLEKTFTGDSDDEDGVSDKDVVYTKLPWEEVERAEDKESIKKECQRLVKEDETFLKLAPELEYQFDFTLDKYVFLAIVLSRFFKQFDEKRLHLVPDEVSEEEFWRNYFYHVELYKKQQGFESRLGDRIDPSLREHAAQ